MRLTLMLSMYPYHASDTSKASCVCELYLSRFPGISRPKAGGRGGNHIPWSKVTTFSPAAPCPPPSPLTPGQTTLIFARPPWLTNADTGRTMTSSSRLFLGGFAFTNISRNESCGCWGGWLFPGGDNSFWAQHSTSNKGNLPRSCEILVRGFQAKFQACLPPSQTRSGRSSPRRDLTQDLS